MQNICIRLDSHWTLAQVSNTCGAPQKQVRGWRRQLGRLVHHPAFPPAQRNVDKQNILVKAVKIQNILDLRGVGA
jgi:hypothetical protein